MEKKKLIIFILIALVIILTLFLPNILFPDCYYSWGCTSNYPSYCSFVPIVQCGVIIGLAVGVSKVF